MVMNMSRALTAENWCHAALRQIASSGTAGVSVEGLARELGVTKGSFYWHFENRQALVNAALSLWAEAATSGIVTELSTITDPTERLQAILESSFLDHENAPTDTALAVSTADQAVADVVRGVTEVRLAFLQEIFIELGKTPSVAKARAHIAYTTYIGHFHLARSLGESDAMPRIDRRFVNQLIDTLTA